MRSKTRSRMLELERDLNVQLLVAKAKRGEIALADLPSEALEFIAYGGDPDRRGAIKAWFRCLTEEQRQQLASAEASEADALAASWGYPA